MLDEHESYINLQKYYSQIQKKNHHICINSSHIYIHIYMNEKYEIENRHETY